MVRVRRSQEQKLGVHLRDVSIQNVGADVALNPKPPTLSLDAELTDAGARGISVEAEVQSSEGLANIRQTRAQLTRWISVLAENASTGQATRTSDDDDEPSQERPSSSSERVGN